MEINDKETQKPNQKTLSEKPKTTSSKQVKEITFQELLSNAQKISSESINKKCC
tara:strand:+ start:688 stop:849 length:162 start_codon:yes stop_codon:yes gene_type:complete